MERNEYIRIPKTRGRLPWRYEEQPQFTLKQRWRLVSVLLLACAGLSIWLFAVLK